MDSSSANQPQQQLNSQPRDLVPGLRRALYWGGLAIVWAATASDAYAQTTNWTNPGVGNWFIDFNWNAGVPNSGLLADIENGGLSFIDSSGAFANFLTLGGAGGQTGFLEVSGAGNLTLSARLWVYNGTTQISSGGRVVVLNNPFIGGATEIGAVGGTGTVLVTGTNSYLNTQLLNLGISVSGNGTGILRIENGGRVDSNLVTAGPSTTTVTGLNSLWSISSYLNMATGGASSLTVSNRGTVNTLYTLIANNSTATVTGVGSSFNNLSANPLSIGLSTHGTLNVQSGGLVTSVNSVIANGATGTATVTGAGSTWNNSGDLSIGGPSGSGVGTGVLNVLNSGVVTSATAALGWQPGSVGTANVTGTGSRWTNSGDVFVGTIGVGTIEIRGGGSVANFRGKIGESPGSMGTVIVSDPGSTWTGGGSFFIGNFGNGSLQVLNGGFASTAGNSYLGYSAGGFGSALVSGAGSTWNTAVTLIIGGNFDGPGGTGRLTIENGGVVDANAFILYSTGELSLANNVTLTGPLTSFGGTMRVTAGNPILSNNMTLESGGLVVRSFGNNPTFSGALSGVGGLTKTGGGMGVLTLTGNSNYSGATTVNSGTLLVNGSITSATTVSSGAKLGGSGSIAADVINNGTVLPGTSPGTLSIIGNYAQGAGGKLQIELESDLSFDKLDVTGNMTLDGTLDVSLFGGFVPAGTQSFDILDWTGSLSGVFSSILLPTLGDSLTWDTSELYTTGVITVIGPTAFAGDYNQNGVVDAADYTVWRDTFGQTGTGLDADGNDNSGVDAGDYDVWTMNFGTTAEATGSVISTTGVPEPTTLWILGSLLCVGAAVRTCIGSKARERQRRYSY